MSIAEPQLYLPLLPYQTRLIRIHSHDEDPDAPLTCDLLTVDLLHPKFRGVGLHPTGDEPGQLVKFTALSYTWEGQKNSKTILCNSSILPVTKNVFEALKAMRQIFFTKKSSTYIWIDSICINQNDRKEKGIQVQNMLQIYQTATRVIAWLGNHEAHAAAITDKNMNEESMQRAYDALQYIYRHSWFQRIWVQQEIFASREMFFGLGDRLLRWRQISSQHERAKEYFEKSSNKDLVEESAQPHVVLDNQLAKLDSFRIFSQRPAETVDLIDALMQTAPLEATDPRDHIYGIIGMTGFPTRPMSIRDWQKHDQSETFIPIDYSADLSDLLTVLTRNLVMKAGLNVVEKFKVFGQFNTENQELPSWVIDWRVTKTLFDSHDTRRDIDNYDVKLDNPWDTGYSPMGMPTMPSHKNHQRTPQSHENFRKANSISTMNFKKITICGLMPDGIYCKGDGIWTKSTNKLACRVLCDLELTDVVVYMLNHSQAGNSIPLKDCFGLFGNPLYFGISILRPVKDDEFKLLEISSKRTPPLYMNWKYNRADIRTITKNEEVKKGWLGKKTKLVETKEVVGGVGGVRPFRHLSWSSMFEPVSFYKDGREVQELEVRTFTIV